MSSRRGSYPHPVLDESDDVSSEFFVFGLSLKMGTTKIEVEFSVELSDEDVFAYVHSGAAELVVRWRCAQTFKLGQFKPTLVSALGRTNKFAASIDQDDVAGKVQLEFQIVARKDIADYCLSAQSTEYGGATFEVRSGDLLANGGRAEFNADKLYDAMDPPVDACFEFIKDPTVTKGILLDFGNERAVQVRLSEATFDAFTVQQTRPALQTSSVLMPALMQTLIHLEEDSSLGGGSADTSWGRTVVLLVARYGVEQLSVVEQAQAILDDPTLRSLLEQSVADGDES